MYTLNITVHLTQTKTQKVGILAQKNGKIYFEYDKDFLKTGLEISPFKLPLKQGVFVCEDNTFNGLWGVFADSLPDGW
jgi:serine/threonine-protein kinase HipA